MKLNIHRKHNVHAFVMFVVILNAKNLTNVLVITYGLCGGTIKYEDCRRTWGVLI